MASAYFRPDLLNILAKAVNEPYQLGLAIGKMFDYIEPLLIYHIENTVDFHNNVPLGLKDYPGFVSAVDDYLKHARIEGNMTKTFPACPPNRNVLTEKRKVIKRLNAKVTVAFREKAVEVLGVKLRQYTAVETRLFNRGVGKILSGAPWVVYPTENVVLAAQPLQWQTWLREHCEELGKIEWEAGRDAMVDL